MDPHILVRDGLIHVAQLAMPRTWVVARARAEPPTSSNAVANLPRYDLRDHFMQGLKAGRLDHNVGVNLGPVDEADPALGKSFNIDAALHFNFAVDD